MWPARGNRSVIKPSWPSGGTDCLPGGARSIIFLDQRLSLLPLRCALTMKPSPEKEIESLRQQIRHHERRYYVDASPEISDLEFDRLMQRLSELEKQNPKLVTTESPTQRVGDQPVAGLMQVAHRV